MGKAQQLRLRAGYDAARQTYDVVRDLARSRKPHIRTVNVRPDMLKRAPELGQPKWLSDDGRME